MGHNSFCSCSSYKQNLGIPFPGKLTGDVLYGLSLNLDYIK